MNSDSRAPILLVEDNPDDQLLTRRAFTKNAITNPLIIANDGAEALVMLHGPNPIRPAIILLDLKMPRVGGHEVLTRIREDARTRHIPVIILTSSAEDQDVLRSYNLCANSYIRKPIDFEEFHRVVGQVGLYWLVINTRAPVRAFTPPIFSPKQTSV